MDNAMQIKVDLNNMMSQFLAHGEGFTDEEVKDLKPMLEKARDAVEGKRGQGMQGWMDSPYNQDEIVEDILKTAKHVRENFDAFVVLGIGGSALGPIAVQMALNHMRYNELPAEKRGGPRFYVEDNVDPERMASLLDVIDVKRTCFNVISKSGATSETMAQYLIIENLLKQEVGDRWTEHMIATTDGSRGNLRPMADREGIKCFTIPDSVGGRFSELCPVGLLPAAICGINIKAMLDGAAYMDELLQNEDDCFKNPALLLAGMMIDAMNKKGKNICVMMPYADSLKTIADWYCQLWAESLGKRFDLEGREVFVGQTPTKSLGVTDQHSQVQLYTEGPFDKIVMFLGVGDYRNEYVIPEGCPDIPAVNFLCGFKLNELIFAEQIATEYALARSGKMNLTITLPEVNAFTIGQLLYFFQMKTAYAGAMLNIDAFDQPGVEEGKNATYALLARPGYEAKKAELDARPKKNPEYIL